MKNAALPPRSDYKRAYECQDSAMVISLRMFNADNEEKIDELITQFETFSANREEEAMQKVYFKKNVTILLLIVSLAISAIAIYLLRQRNRKQRASKKMLETRIETIEQDHKKEMQMSSEELETAIKTKQIMNSARGNVLFIDEAYSLVHNGNDTFGNEAVNTIIAEMENNRNNMVVILAGYSKEMADFLSSNQGFKSRINRYITFSDYEAKDLVEIYKRLAKKSKNILDENAMVALKDVMDMTEKRKGTDFGNARFVRNLYEKTIEEMNNRLSHDFSSISNKKLMEITSQDIYNAFQYIEV